MKKFAKILSLMLVVVIAAMFVACAPASDPDKAVSALEKNGYTAAKDANIAPAALRLFGVSGVDCVVTGACAEEGKEGSVSIVYFSSSKDANAAWDKIQEYAKDEKEDEGNEDSDWQIKKSGKMVYWGNSNGIKAAR